MGALPLRVGADGDGPLGLDHLAGQAIGDALAHGARLAVQILRGADVELSLIPISEPTRPY